MRILVVRFAAIGDCVMTSWAVTALRTSLPDAHITWAVQERCAPVIDTQKLTQSVHVFPRERWKKTRWSPGTWVDQLVRYTALRKQNLDVGFDFQGHSKTALCLRLAGCKERFASRATDALAARLNPPLKLNPEGPHEVQLALALVKHRFEVALPDLPMMPRVEASAPSGRDRPVITVQTGAGEAAKVYPPTALSQVAESLAESGIEVIAVGGPSDPHLQTVHAKDMVGKCPLRETLALVASSDLHIAGDTGTGHAAAAYGVPTVSLFGPTDPNRFRPWSSQGLVLQKGATTETITPAEVVSATHEQLRSRTVARAH